MVELVVVVVTVEVVVVVIIYLLACGIAAKRVIHSKANVENSV